MSIKRNRVERRERRRLAREQKAAQTPAPALTADTVEAQPAPAPPVLRLVRSEETSLLGEPIAGGCASTPGDRVYDLPGGGSGDEPEARNDHVVAAAPSRSDQDGEIDLPLDLVRRTFDASDVNPIVNHPDVFPMVATEGIEEGGLDLGPALSDTRNVALVAEGAVILFFWHEPGAYEVHSCFLKPDRSRQSTQGPFNRNVCLSAYRWMFTHTDCVSLLTKIPAHNRAAAIFSPLVGWVKEFERKNIWPTVTGERVDMSFCAIHYDDWVRKSTFLRKTGRAFHGRLTEEFKRHGREEVAHDDDDWHDQHVGACAEMVMSGQCAKGVALYNRWARWAGYGLMNLVASENPAVIDIGNALLQMTGDSFKVVLVR